MTADPKYPDIKVQLSGQDGNAFGIIGAVTKAMRRAGLPAGEIAATTDDMMSGDFDHLLRVAMRTVSVA